MTTIILLLCVADKLLYACYYYQLESTLSSLCCFSFLSSVLSVLSSHPSRLCKSSKNLITSDTHTHTHRERERESKYTMVNWLRENSPCTHAKLSLTHTAAAAANLETSLYLLSAVSLWNTNSGATFSLALLANKERSNGVRSYNSVFFFFHISRMSVNKKIICAMSLWEFLTLFDIVLILLGRPKDCCNSHITGYRNLLDVDIHP